jgi:hypothetical protein
MTSMAAFSQFPIIRSLHKLFMRIGPNLKRDKETILATMKDVYKISADDVIPFDERKAIDFVCEVYGCTERHIRELEEFIDSQKSLPFLIPYDKSHWFYDVDVEDDLEGSVGNFVDSEAAFRENIFI